MGFQRDHIPLAGRGAASHILTKRFAKGEFQNSPVDCFERGNALQEKAFPEFIIILKIERR